MSDTRQDLIDAFTRLGRGFTDAAVTLADIILGVPGDDLMPVAPTKPDEVLSPADVYAGKNFSDAQTDDVKK
jgi:hypothetical protein